MLKMESIEAFATLEAGECPRCGKISQQPKKQTIWYCPFCQDVDLRRNWRSPEEDDEKATHKLKNEDAS